MDHLYRRLLNITGDGRDSHQLPPVPASSGYRPGPWAPCPAEESVVGTATRPSSHLRMEPPGRLRSVQDWLEWQILAATITTI
jgi:hypothetical protein